MVVQKYLPVPALYRMDQVMKNWGCKTVGKLSKAGSILMVWAYKKNRTKAFGLENE